MNHHLLTRRRFVAPVAVMVAILLTTVTAVGTLALANAWGWGTNIGWVNLGPPIDPVVVCADHLEGHAWGENVGWIRLGTVSGCGPHTYPNTSNADYGVNRNGANNLSGFAWGTNVGWINFSPAGGGVAYDPVTERLVGYAWGENVGWIRFNPAYGGAPPTAAQVLGFTARPVAGGNLVRWATATEARVNGFHVYRGGGPEGPWARVNEALVPATGSAGGGGRYELLDARATAGATYYRLEVVSEGAPSTFVGPVAVARAADALFLPWGGRGVAAPGQAR